MKLGILFCLRILFSIFFILFLPFSVSIHAVGSDTAVNRFTSQVTLVDLERVASFASLEAGFLLASGMVRATFDSVFPVAGKIDLNNGTLILKKDLHVDNNAEMVWLGHVIGNGHLFDLSQSVSLLVTDSNKGDSRNCRVGLLFTQALNAQLSAADWSYDRKYVGTASSNRLAVYSFSEAVTVLQNAINLTTLALVPVPINALRWHPVNRYLLAVGTQSFLGLSQELRTYLFNPVGPTLTQVGSANIGADCTAVSWHPSGNYLVAGTLNTTSEIILYSVSAGGVLTQQQVINLVPTRTVNFQSMDWNATGEFLSVGTAISGTDPNLLVYQFNQAGPSLTLQASQAPLKLVWSTSWNPTYTNVLAVTYQIAVGDMVEIFEHKLTGATTNDRLVKKSGIADTLIGYSCDWHSGGHCLSVGKSTLVSSTEFRIYSFNPTTYALSLAIGFDSTSAVQETRWAGDYILAGGNGSLISFYKKSSRDCFSFWNTHLTLGRDVTVKDICLTFSGLSSVNGFGNKLVLSGDAEIVIDKKGTLLMQDMVIEGVHNNSIRCLDSKSTLTLDRVMWSLDGSYSFTVGHFDILNDFEVQGSNYTFSYQTDQPSCIQKNSTFVLSDDLTFLYNPKNNKGNLLQFVDRSSELVLSNMTLCSTKTGIRFTKGTIWCDGESIFKSEGSKKIEGIFFGDGATKANNILVKLRPYAGIGISSGFLVYQNV